MDRTFNSIGSNIFFEFGKEVKIEIIKGRKIVEKEWSIWISHAAWRITKNDKYFIGSNENLDINIQSYLEKLLGKRFQSFQIISQFLDAEFNFEDGYKLTTFFDWVDENQWTIFLPDDSNIEVDCSSEEAIKNVQSIAKHFVIKDTYKKQDLHIKEAVVVKFTFNEHNLPVFHFENNSSLHLEICAWRLEKNGDYIIGCLDRDHERIKKELLQLVGKKLKEADIANAMMDAKFQFEGGYVLKTFTCCRADNQWSVRLKGKPVFSARISIADQD